MFAFINGRSLNARLSNWSLIQQFIAKKKLPISMESINATIHGREGGAEELLEQTYQLFTNKKFVREKKNIRVQRILFVCLDHFEMN